MDHGPFGPSRERWPRALVLGLLAALPIARAAQAQTATCQERDGSAPGLVTLTYEGPDSGGTLRMKGAFGDLALSAFRRTEPPDPGKSYRAFGIRASESGSIRMPDRAALETCMRPKLTPDEAKDDDLVMMSMMSCQRTTPMGAAPVEARIVVEFASTEPGMVDVFVQRTYADPSSINGKRLTIESVPPPECKLGP